MQVVQSSYIRLIREQTGLLALAFLAVFSGNFGQSFFIGLFQQPLSEQLELSAGGFGGLYASVTLISGFLVLRLWLVHGQWHPNNDPLKGSIQVPTYSVRHVSGNYYPYFWQFRLL